MSRLSLPGWTDRCEEVVWLNASQMDRTLGRQKLRAALPCCYLRLAYPSLDGVKTQRFTAEA